MWVPMLLLLLLLQHSYSVHVCILQLRWKAVHLHAGCMTDRGLLLLLLLVMQVLLPVVLLSARCMQHGMLLSPSPVILPRGS